MCASIPIATPPKPTTASSSPNGKWRWNSAGIGGATALDFLTKVRGVSFVEAVEILTGERAMSARSYQHTAKSKPSPEKRPLSLPKPVRYSSAVTSYLQDRGIHPAVVGKCVRAGTIYEARNNGETVCVFVGKDDVGKARFACMRGVRDKYHRDATGSDKRFSFRIPAADPDSGYLAVFESPIDALSHATLQINEGRVWDGHRLSLGGTSNVALLAFLERNPLIRHIDLCLDNDEAGQLAAKGIRSQIIADERFVRISVSIEPPKVGKDYNEALLHAVNLEREQKKQRRREAAHSI